MNYHELQQPIENEYQRKLEHLFSSLFNDLSRIPLDEYMIKHVFNKWYTSNERYLQQVTLENINEAIKLSNEVIFDIHENAYLEEKLVKANLNLINAELRKLNESVNILATQANTYSFSRVIINERLHEIFQATIHALELLAVNTTILNTRELLFGNAQNNGYTHYLGWTQDDDRVRIEHYTSYHNIWIPFSAPPAIGHVGTQINCRCYAKSFK